jgi:hypothetical protein
VALAGLLVPVVWIGASHDLAVAASNSNPFHTVDFDMEERLASDVHCHGFASRYNPDGTGVVWQDTTCYGGLQADPFDSTTIPPEGGTDYTLTFKGARAGAPIESAPLNEAKNESDMVTINFGASTGLHARATSGSLSVTSVRGHADVKFQAAIKCLDPVTYAEQSGTWTLLQNWTAAGTFGWSWTCPAGMQFAWVQVIDYWTGTPSYTHETKYVAQYVPGDGTDPSDPGQGAGDPCEASYSGETADSPESTWQTTAGVLPAGSVAFPATPSGACLVTQICLEMFQEKFGPDGHWESCESVDFGAPVQPDPAGADPTPPPGAGEPQLPHAEDEASFWDQVLGALQGLFGVLGKGLMAIVHAIEALVGDLLDGLSGLLQTLFVPHPSSWDLDGLVEQVHGRPPGSVIEGSVGAATSVSDGYQAASGGCANLIDLSPAEGDEVKCSTVKDIGGFAAAYALVQAAIWASAAFAIFKLVSIFFRETS